MLKVKLNNCVVRGNGPISAFLNALQLPIDVLNYEERSISSGANAKALTLIELQVKGTGIYHLVQVFTTTQSLHLLKLLLHVPTV